MSPFVPHKPESKITCIITKREAILLQNLRKCHFGKFIVHKQNNLIIRVEPQISKLITGDEKITLD